MSGAFYDIALPRHYSLVLDADLVELIAPSGRRIVTYSMAGADPAAIEDAAWTHYREVEMHIQAAERRLDRIGRQS